MRDQFIKFMATGLGVGRIPIAPGTMGSLVGVGYWWLLARGNPWTYWIICPVVLVFAVWCAGHAAELLRQPDPPCVVIDEIAAMPVVFAGISIGWWHAVVGLVFFRLFDIWKPPPVRQSQAFIGGIGIVLDDVLAALYACAATHGVVWLVARLSR